MPPPSRWESESSAPMASAAFLARNKPIPVEASPLLPFAPVKNGRNTRPTSSGDMPHPSSSMDTSMLSPSQELAMETNTWDERGLYFAALVRNWSRMIEMSFSSP